MTFEGGIYTVLAPGPSLLLAPPTPAGAMVPIRLRDSPGRDILTKFGDVQVTVTLRRGRIVDVQQLPAPLRSSIQHAHDRETDAPRDGLPIGQGEREVLLFPSHPNLLEGLLRPGHEPVRRLGLHDPLGRIDVGYADPLYKKIESIVSD